jgi:hypothetical protein
MDTQEQAPPRSEQERAGKNTAMNAMEWMRSTPLYGTDFEFDFRGPLLDDWGPVARVKRDSEIAAAEKALKEARIREQASES